jgi:predicted oxidoreductase
MDGQVLDGSGEVVEGLYAVGEAAGMYVPGFAGRSGIDGSLSAVVWSGWRTADVIEARR